MRKCLIIQLRMLAGDSLMSKKEYFFRLQQDCLPDMPDHHKTYTPMMPDQLGKELDQSHQRTCKNFQSTLKRPRKHADELGIDPADLL